MEDLETKITLKDIQDHTSRHGHRKTQKILSVLGRKYKFVEVIKTPIGQQLLKDMMMRLDELLEKNLKVKITEKERVEYDLLSKLTDTWIARIHSYLQTANKLKGD